MGVLFTKSRMTLNFRKDKPVVYHLQQVNYSIVDTDAFVADIAESCGMNRAMTRAVMEAMASRLCRYLGMGHAVQLGDIGTIKPVFTAKATESVDELGADNIRSKKVRYYPSQRIKDVMKGISVSECTFSEGTIVGDDEDME